MKYKLRIGEFAKLKNVTTETLRHYDRVNLLKPIEIDDETGYRYYSVFQSGKLASIIELKALGFSIEEMKFFFEGRELKQTYELLNRKRYSLQEKIKNLQKLENSLAKKLGNISDMMALESDGRYIIRTEPECQIAFIESPIKDKVQFEWVASDIENQLIKIHSVIGTDGYGLIISESNFLDYKLFGETNIIYFLDSSVGIDPSLIRSLPKKKVACFLLEGPLVSSEKLIQWMIESLGADGYQIVGDIIIKVRVGTESTDIVTEQRYEFQIPVK